MSLDAGRQRRRPVWAAGWQARQPAPTRRLQPEAQATAAVVPVPRAAAAGRAEETPAAAEGTPAAEAHTEDPWALGGDPWATNQTGWADREADMAWA
eukprot:4178838-Lingulodinium_polyedra.AAC.1